MYESFFRLSQRPFLAAPTADAFVGIGSLEQARQNLVRCIDRCEGPALVIGPAGTGKTLLCRVLAKHFQSRFRVAHLAGARLGTRRSLLQNILFELKLPYRDMDEGELRLALIDHLEPGAGAPDGLLLLVDEAHALPLRLLEEIRLLTNVVREGAARIRLVLCGGMSLEERLASPKLESFHQRIAVRCYLQPLGREETAQYIREQIRCCGGSPDAVFAPEVAAAVHTATDGIPRLINQVVDHGLMLAALGGHRQLNAAAIEEAWADLQQLPLPLHDPPELASPGEGASVIEFGQLTDEVRSSPPSNASMGEAAVASVEAISRTLDSLDEDEQNEPSDPREADFAPPLGTTEVELVFHGAHDPFGGQWDEEEVVIDRYASLEDAALRSRRVVSDEGRTLGAAVSAAVADSARFESVLPARRAEAAHSADSRGEQCNVVPLKSVPDDDRDLIMLDQEEPQRPAPTSVRPRRPEYRQLFTHLRSK
jgi:type II secretory pathway predicted ATPase ExeA